MPPAVRAVFCLWTKAGMFLLTFINERMSSLWQDLLIPMNRQAGRLVYKNMELMLHLPPSDRTIYAWVSCFHALELDQHIYHLPMVLHLIIGSNLVFVMVHGGFNSISFTLLCCTQATLDSCSVCPSGNSLRGRKTQTNLVHRALVLD